MWSETLGRRHSTWLKQRITFTTTEANHTLKMYTTWSGWFNFYIDDIALYEEDTLVPLDGDSFLFFGNSTGSQSANVEIEYVSVDNTGAYAPEDVFIQAIDNAKNMSVFSSNGNLNFNVLNPASVNVYDVAGTLVYKMNVDSQKSISLPKGIYIVKSVSQGAVETVKVINR